MIKSIMKGSAILLCSASVLYIPTTVYAQTSDSATVTATAEILDQGLPLSISIDQPLYFGQVLRPALAGDICGYFIRSTGSTDFTYNNGFNNVVENCEFATSDQAAAELTVSCQPNSAVRFIANYLDAGLTDITFTDTPPANRPYPVVLRGLSDVRLSENNTMVCTTGGIINVDIGGHLLVGSNAVLGEAQVGTVTIEASYE